MTVDADKNGIGWAGQIFNHAKGRQSGYIVFARMHHPDFPRKADLLALPDHFASPSATTNDSNGLWIEKPRQPIHQAPKGRSNSRLMMWR